MFSLFINTSFLVSGLRANLSVGNRSGYLKVSRTLPSFSPSPFSNPSTTSAGTPSSCSRVNQMPPFSSFRFFWNWIEIWLSRFLISLKRSRFSPAGRPRPFLM